MRIAFLYGSFSLGNRPFNFDDLYGDPRGLTGSELSCIEYAQAMQKRGHEVLLVVGQEMAPREWRGIQIRQLDDPRAVDDCDVVYSWNEPNLLREVKPGGPLRVCNQQLNDFAYCRAGWEEWVDLLTSPSAHHLEFLKKQAPAVKAWEVVPNGCDPGQYRQDHRIPGRVIWASSADRGLHLLLSMWPEIKRRVPHASLRCFYNFTAAHFDDYEAQGPNVHPDLLEIAQRKRYIRYAMSKLAGPEWDVEHVGSVSRERVRAEFEKAEVLGYPCDTIRYCVTGETLVDTERGLRRIDSLRDAEGLSVASTDGAYVPVGKWFDSGTREAFAVRTRHGYAVSGTSNHPLLVLTPELKLEWREIGNLRVGDHVCVNRAATRFPERLVFPPFQYDRPKVTCGPDEKILPSEMTPELGVILGYLASEGSIGTHQIGFCNKDPEVLRDFESCWAKCFPDTRLHAFMRPNGVGERQVHSQYVISFFRHIGLAPGDAFDKHVPWSILQADRESVAGFIGAYFEGDGSVARYYTHVVSVSNALLRDVHLLLLKFGIVSVFHAREDEDRLGYVKIGGRDNLLAFQSLIGFRSSRKRGYEQATDCYTRPHLDKIPYVRAMVEKTLGERERGASRYNQHTYETDGGATVVGSKSGVLCGDGRYGLGSMLSIRDQIRECAPRVRPISDALASKMEWVCGLPYLFDPIVEVGSVGVVGTFDLSVPVTHAFTGNGIICHNTEGFSVTTLEACASGCLPIITDVDALGSIYGGAARIAYMGLPGTILSPGKDPVPFAGGFTQTTREHFVELVVESLVDDEARADGVALARLRAEDYAWPVLAERLETVLEAALSKRGAKGKTKSRRASSPAVAEETTR